MKRSSIAIGGIVVSILMSGTSIATAASNIAPSKIDTRSMKAVDKDFGRLSAAGVSAFDDVHLARLAIYDGKTDEATKLIADAKASLAIAKGDDTVFTKAETAFNVKSKNPQHSEVDNAKNPVAVAWIPIDGELVLGETFQSTPDKAAAVVTARKTLERGDIAKSFETIKLAGVDVDYTMALAPLEASISDLDQADKLITSHDYYGASQALRQAEAGIRYDEIDDVANVQGKSKQARADTR